MITLSTEDGEFQSKQGWGQYFYFMPGWLHATVTQTKLRQSQIDFREIINWTNCFLVRTGTGTLCQLVAKIPTFSLSLNDWGHLTSNLSLSLSLRVVLEIRAIERVMQGNAMFQTFTDRHLIPPLPPTYKFTTVVVSRKNRYRVELSVRHGTEAEGWKIWKLFILTVDNWSW